MQSENNSTPIIIPPFKVYAVPGTSRPPIYNATGNIDIDIENAIQDKNEYASIIGNLFNNFQNYFKIADGILSVCSKFKSKIPERNSMHETLCDSIMYYLGKRVLNEPILEKNSELRKVLRESYNYLVSLNEWMLIERIESSLGGKSVIERITRE